MPKRRRRIPRYLRLEAEQAREKREQSETFPTVIPADASQQAPNNSYSGRGFYYDQPFRCADCGKEEVWTARQQQWWYEVAKGPIHSGAARCRECRITRRLKHGGTPRVSHVERLRKREESDPRRGGRIELTGLGNPA